MRWMRSAAVVGLLVGLGVLVPSAPACACDCAAITAEEAMVNADAVFVGTAVQVATPWFGLGGGSADPETVAFDVSTVYKGIVPANAQQQTARDGASCGYNFTEGSQYLVFVRVAQDGGWSTTSCSGTQLDPRADVLPVAGYAPAPPVAHPRDWAVTVLVGAAAVAAVGVVIVFLVRSRRRRASAARSA